MYLFNQSIDLLYRHVTPNQFLKFIADFQPAYPLPNNTRVRSNILACSDRNKAPTSIRCSRRVSSTALVQGAPHRNQWSPTAKNCPGGPHLNHTEVFRDEVEIYFGAPITFAEYLEICAHDRQQAIGQLTTNIHHRQLS